MNPYIPVAARLLLAQLFVATTVIQFSIFINDPNGYENFRVYLGQHGLAGIFAPLMILVQILGGAALLLGFKTRMAAWVMAGYAIFIAFALRLNEPILFMQYLAIAGGLMALAVISPTACSLDKLRKKF